MRNDSPYADEPYTRSAEVDEMRRNGKWEIKLDAPMTADQIVERSLREAEIVAARMTTMVQHRMTDRRVARLTRADRGVCQRDDQWRDYLWDRGRRISREAEIGRRRHFDLRERRPY